MIKRWNPGIIHTLGIFDGQGGLFYLLTRQKYRLEHYGKWVLQLRGGSDIALRRYHPESRKTLQAALGECDQIICDNRANVEYAAELGIPATKFAPIVPVPGSGGMDLGEASTKTSPPSQRERIILWPKAYESPWSKALPVLDAIQAAWGEIEPCEIYMLAVTPEVYDWHLSLPEKMRRHCQVLERISRKEVLSLMKRARVMLAPSLIDGVPNSLYEAMACGAFPIVSPLETITPLVRQEKNVLFARNLYPDEIANALIRSMSEDQLIDDAAKQNMQLVKEVADRSVIARQVSDFYADLVRKRLV